MILMIIMITMIILINVQCCFTTKFSKQKIFTKSDKRCEYESKK